MFENLIDRLEHSFKLLKGEGRITEINIAETLKDVRKALLDADVSYKLAKSFCDSVKEKALGMDVLKSIKPGQMMVKIVHDELAALMGSTSSDINIKGNPGIVLVSGLQGSGKTTFSGKLALNCKSKRGLKVLLVAGDVYRPAAIDQLKVLGGQIGVTVYSEEGNKNPVEIAKNAVALAKREGYSLVIVDTAGRLAVDEQMMQEIAAIKEAIKPTETLFVVDSMTGQDAVETAKTFNERLDFDGVVLTKLDGDTRGGAALSVGAGDVDEGALPFRMAQLFHQPLHPSQPLSGAQMDAAVDIFQRLLVGHVLSPEPSGCPAVWPPSGGISPASPFRR